MLVCLTQLPPCTQVAVQSGIVGVVQGYLRVIKLSREDLDALGGDAGRVGATLRCYSVAARQHCAQST